MVQVITPAIKSVPAPAEATDAFRRVQAGGSLIAAPLPGFTPSSLWGDYTPIAQSIRDMLGPSQLTVLFGMSGHFKSAIKTDMVMCLATGTEYHGRRVKRTGVLCIEGEGHHGTRKRVRAWMLSHGLNAESEQPSVYFTSAAGDLMGGQSQLKATADAAEEALQMPIGVIAFDTFAANLGQGDENHASDMSYSTGNARAVRPDAGVLMVHHSGHGSDARERGSSVLAASADYRLRAAYDDSTRLIELSFLKVKDDERPEPMMFTWEKVGLGWTDDEGDELTSVVLKRCEDGAIPAPALLGLGVHQEAVLKALRNIYRARRRNLEDRGDDPNGAVVLIDALRLHVEKKVDRKRFPEAIKALRERRLIVVDGPHIRLGDGTL